MNADEPPTRLARLRAFWARLQAEDIPRLAGYALLVLVVAGAGMTWIEGGRNEAFRTFEDGAWWALVTLTTIGYGDKFPVTTSGRLLASVVMLFGVGMLGIVMGKVASILVEKRIKEGRGLSDAMHLQRHFVVLGWKRDMRQFLQDIFTVNPDVRAAQVVLVNAADELLNQELRDAFPGVVYVRGEMVDAAVLARANVTRAARVIILADEAQARPDQETDGHTVMAAMTIKSMAPEVYTCAEVLDRKYEEHLRLARCDEVILSREYSRFLLVTATRSAGVAHVLHDLIDLTDLRGLATHPIPPGFVGRTVAELAAHFKRQDRLLIGLLENTGRARAIKRDALREAQKTANVATLVENLKRVKELQPNRPHLNPPDDYVITPHTLAIAVGHVGPVA